MDADREQRSKAWNVIAGQMVPIYILATFFTLAMSEVLINILVDSKFHDSYIYTMFGVLIEFFRVMTNLLNNVSQSEYKTTATIKPYLLGFVVSVGLLSFIDVGSNYFLIPLVLGLSYLLVFLYMYINMRKILDIKYELSVYKLIILSIPFSLVYLLDVKSNDIVSNMLIIFPFGIYFLFAIWFLNRKRYVM